MAVDLNNLRQRILNGDTYTREELREAIEACRTVRVEAAMKTVSKRIAAAPMTDLDLDASLKQAGLDF